MPSKSPKQAKLMRAVAHGWKKPGGGGPTRDVAREFVNADRRKKVSGYQYGGPANFRGMPGNRADMRSRFPAYSGPMATTNPVSMPPQGGGLQQFSRSMSGPGGRGGRGGGFPGPGGPPPQGFPPGGGGRGGPGGQVPWRGAPPPRAMPGGGRGMPRPGGPPPQGPMPQGGGGGGGLRQMMQRLQQQQGGGGGQPGGGGGLRQMMQRLQQQQGGGQPGGGGGGRYGSLFGGQSSPPMMPPNKGPRIAPPPGKYPGGGNPMTGGRNPMMRQTGRYGGRGGRGGSFR